MSTHLPNIITIKLTHPTTMWCCSNCDHQEFPGDLVDTMEPEVTSYTCWQCGHEMDFPEPPCFSRKQYLEWVARTFPAETFGKQAIHLIEESDELEKNPGDPMEMADVSLMIICLEDRLRRLREYVRKHADDHGVDLHRAMIQKFEIVKKGNGS